MKHVKLKIYRKFIVYYYPNGDKPIRISTNIKSNNYIIKNKISKVFYNDNPSVLSKLNQANNFIEQYIIKTNLDPEPKKIRSILLNEDELLAKNKSEIPLLKYYKDFYNYKSRTLLKKSSGKDYKSFWNSLEDFEKEHNTVLIIKDIDEDFVHEYSVFMTQERKKSNLSFITNGKVKTNTLKKRLDNLKTFFKWLHRNEIIDKVPMFITDISIKKEKVYKTHLTTDEVLAFYNIDFNDDLKNKVKDIFVFACHTGMRYSDFSTLTVNHFVTKNNFSFVRKKAEKVSEEFLVPLTDIANSIRIRHDHNFKMVNQFFNRILRTICAESGLFNQDFLDENTNTVYKRHQVITAHVARHSFITNLVNSNVSINAIMGMTGHRKLETLNIYLHSKEPTDNLIVNDVFC